MFEKRFFLLLLIAILLPFSGCIDENTASDITEATEILEDIAQSFEIEESQPELENATSSYAEPGTDVIRVGAFNVQVFGVSKANKPEVMGVLADIVRTYDIVAIQEIRDKSQTALPELMELVNSEGSQYNYTVSERLGRTSSKEQYAYLYNTKTVTLVGIPETYPEPNGTDPFHRQPYIASFATLNGNYDAVFVVIHTDPDEATEEINSLDDVLNYTQSAYPDEEDFIIMGDFNADGSYFDEDGTSDLDAYTWVIDDSLDTTTKSTDYTYDRIVLTDSDDLADDFGIFRYDLEYMLDANLTTAVSDHYPVYAEFWVMDDSD